ncbi:MAG TPA: NlpC/P60 family protein [Acidimicrobiales bacterium]|nr:NlpC/P60 family protein [Acidimicrobiales bacterium]
MTTGSVELNAIQRALSDMQSAAGVPSAGTPSPISSSSFATTLAQATNDLSSGGGLATTSDPLFIGMLNASTTFAPMGVPSLAGGSAGELSLIALLVSAQQGTGTSASSTYAPVARVSTPTLISTPIVQGPSGTGGITGGDVVHVATQYEGTPYLWGGTSPRGFDCSGFAQYVYAQLGVSLPRTSEEQAMIGTPVSSLSNAQPGDLLFFAGSDGTASSPGHVGIYMGNGEMIDAPYTGTTVQVQSLATAGPVVAIRRVLASGVAGAAQ